MGASSTRKESPRFRSAFAVVFPRGSFESRRRNEAKERPLVMYKAGADQRREVGWIARQLEDILISDKKHAQKT